MRIPAENAQMRNNMRFYEDGQVSLSFPGEGVGMLGAVCAVHCVGDGAVLLAECQFQQRLPVGCLDVHTIEGAVRVTRS